MCWGRSSADALLDNRKIKAIVIQTGWQGGGGLLHIGWFAAVWNAASVPRAPAMLSSGMEHPSCFPLLLTELQMS